MISFLESDINTGFRTRLLDGICVFPEVTAMFLGKLTEYNFRMHEIFQISDLRMVGGGDELYLGS